MSILYDREVELFIDSLRFSGDELTIYFDVPFSDSPEANVASIEIYNLSDQTLAKIRDKNRIILNAGYIDSSGAILLGEAKSLITQISGVDRITTIQALDGSDSWFSMIYQNSFNPGVSASTILNTMISGTGIQIGSFTLPVDFVYKSGRNVKGTLSAIIKTIAQDCGAKAYITQGKVFIRPKNEGVNIGFILDSNSGLIGSPTPIERDKRRGFRVTMLLNHRITSDSLIQITSRTANGIYRVESGRHYSTGASFYTEAEVFPA